MDVDSSLDFEAEDVIINPVGPGKKRCKRIIGLDDLLNDFYEEKSKIEKEQVKREKARKRAFRADRADYPEKDKEEMLSEFVDRCEKQVNEIITEDEIPSWGLPIFAQQKSFPVSSAPTTENCNVMKAFANSEIDPILDLSDIEGERFLEGLLLNDWLMNLLLTSGSIDDSVASWTFHLLLYSSNAKLQEAAYDFWCSILSYLNKVDNPQLNWTPNYSKIKDALDLYGYRWGFPTSAPDSGFIDPAFLCPPHNIRLFVKFVAAFCESRIARSTLSVTEVESLLVVVSSLFLDRQLQGILALLQESLLSVMCFFTDDEWKVSSKNVANSIASSVPKDLNSLHVVECISGIHKRSKHFRSEVAYQILISCLNEKVDAVENTLRFLTSINMKDKHCNFFHIYFYLVLADNWLLPSSVFKERPELLNVWSAFLRNCSCHITSTDWRSYASKVRNKASYLMQFYNCEQKQ